MHPRQQLEEVFHYVAPVVILLYYLVAATITVCTLQTARSEDERAPRKSILSVMLVVMLTYGFDAIVIISQLTSGGASFATKDSNVYALSSLLVWLIIIVSLSDSTFPVWYPYYGSWLLAFIVEICLLSMSLSYQRPSNDPERAEFAIHIFRLLSLVLLPALLFGSRPLKRHSHRDDEESAPLLGHARETSEDTQDSKGNSNYGSTGTNQSLDSSPKGNMVVNETTKVLDEEEEKMKLIQERLKKDGNWWTYTRGFSVFIPYIWPTNDNALKLNMVGVACCLLCLRALNVLVPRQLGIVVNSLGDSDGNVPYVQLGLFVLYTWASSSAGVMGLKDWLYVPVKLYSYKAINTASYNQIMGLSSDFHDSKQSGELYKSMDQGASVIDLLETVLFDVLPMLADLIIACAYLYYLFDAYMALIVAATILVYLWFSTSFSTKLAAAYRDNVRLSRGAFQVMYDTMGGWKTVSYFNRMDYERQRYSTAVELHVKSKKHAYLLQYLGWAVKTFLLDAGLYGACFFATYQVLHGNQSVGSFVTLLTYWAELSLPLSFFSHAHNHILNSLTSAEQLLKLFQTSATVKDGQKLFVPMTGKVDYKNVSFAYDGEKRIIKNLSLNVKPGQTIALVGETGGGKSTILKLLFRFHDVSEGSILVDNQDIRDVTLQSLRECIGVVPQDPSLFNDTIMGNVRYARLDATDQEVMEACKAAAIHEKILTFTNGYQSKVGEHGVKLSGGELQRIAIARAILKDPKIILLDEATSSVDSETEGKIQEALNRLAKGRTTFVVAHRLSTVMDADQILVIKDGEILEQGPPQELLLSKGEYYLLWSKQMGLHQTVAAENINSFKETTGESDQDILGSFSKKVFRPDAPEFVPLHQRGTASKGGDASYQHNHSAPGNAQDAASDKKTDKDKDRKPKSRKRKAKPDGTVRATDPQTERPVSDQVGQGSNAVSSTNGPSTKTPDAGTKRFRFNRRKQSKSEPGGRALQQSQGDGASEFDMTPDGSGEGRPMANSSRRVSAPSDPPSEPVNMGGSTFGPRRRRQRHWRDRNRNSSAAQSGTQSSGRSVDWSAETPQHGSHPAPFTSPAAGVTPSNELAKVPSGSGVRFAPGF